jgi:hypothetical protein
LRLFPVDGSTSPRGISGRESVTNLQDRPAILIV